MSDNLEILWYALIYILISRISRNMGIDFAREGQFQCVFSGLGCRGTPFRNLRFREIYNPIRKMYYSSVPEMKRR